jgi:hypothetical protein
VLRVLNNNNQQPPVSKYTGIVYISGGVLSILPLGGIANGLISQPWILAFIILLILVMAVWLVWVIRRVPRRNGTRGLQEETKTVFGKQNSSLPVKPAAKVDERKMNPPAAFSIKAPPSGNGATRPVGRVVSLPPVFAVEPPPMQLRIYRSGDPALLGKTITVSPLPFFIGSQDSHLSIVKDSFNVRRYAQISYDQVQKRYLIIDLQSPTGVWLNGVRIAPSMPSPLLPGMMIALGKDTQLLFG